ncbi:MAG: DUF4139 domain-containing protein [Polyangiaceae bacterium]
MIRSPVLAVAALGLVACGNTPPTTHAPTDPGGPTTSKKSDSATREKVGITVYNQNFGLVREVRSVDLAKGRVALEFGDVSALIQPETVALKALDDPNALSVLEQNYRYDLLTPEKLLEKYVGKQVKVLRWNEKLGQDEEKDATVLSVEGGTTLQIGSEITAGFPGRITFPGVPDNLIAKPTLVWLLASTVEKQRIEATYLTQGLNWHADYVLVVDKDDTVGDLHGWVTLANDTGTTFKSAELKLVAGDVQRLNPNVITLQEVTVAPPEEPAPPPFQEEGLFEYHLYTLDHPTDLLDKEQKQVTLLDAVGVGVTKKLIFSGFDGYYHAPYNGMVSSNQKVSVFLDFENSEKNHMGMPLPKGTVRVYKADGSGARQFIGEDAIDHTPRDEKIRVKMGEAFDVVADRKQTDWTAIDECSSESAYEIEIRNHKDNAEKVEIDEPVSGDWEILNSSHESKRKDAHMFVFDVDVPAKGKTTVTYRVRVRWC